MKSRITKLLSTYIIFFVALSLVFMPSISVLANTVTDLNKTKTDLQNKIKQNQQQQAAKQQEAAQIASQITVVSGQIDQTAATINSTADQIGQTEQKVASLEQQVKTQEENLAKEQDKFSQVIASWYMGGESGLMEAILGANNVSEIMNQQQYYDSVRQQITGTMDQIEKLKIDLNTQKEDQTRQLASLSDLKKSQESQKSYLEDRKSLKGRLLGDTKSALSDLKDEEQQTQALIAQIQAKIDKIRAASTIGGGDLVSSVDSSWYYRQDDSRWASNKIGRYATIGQVGCLLTSLTMVAKFYGHNYDPASAVAASAFVTGGSYDGSLISTSIVSDGKSQLIDWATVDSELAAGHPVILGVALGVDMGNSYGVSHFVVVKSKIGTDKYAIHDPLGENRGYYKSQVKAMRIIRP